MLQLHKMHSRHGTLSSIILWQTHLQRLQIQLQTAHSNSLHSIYRSVSSNIRTLLCGHKFNSGQSSGFCNSFSVYNLQRLNMANQKKHEPTKIKLHCGCKSKNKEIPQPVVLYLSCFNQISSIETLLVDKLNKFWQQLSFLSQPTYNSLLLKGMELIIEFKLLLVLFKDRFLKAFHESGATGKVNCLLNGCLDSEDREHARPFTPCQLCLR